MASRRKKEAKTETPAEEPANWTVEYLSEDVLAESEEWPVKLQANLQRIIDRIESRGLPSLTAEHAKHIRGKIWELRPDAEGVEGRAFYVTVTGKRVVIVLCKIKKRQKTPNSWIELAEERAKTLE